MTTTNESIDVDIMWACYASMMDGMVSRMVVGLADFPAHLERIRAHADMFGMVLRVEHTTPTLVLCSAYYPSRGPQDPEWRVEIEAE